MARWNEGTGPFSKVSAAGSRPMTMLMGKLVSRYRITANGHLGPERHLVQEGEKSLGSQCLISPWCHQILSGRRFRNNPKIPETGRKTHRIGIPSRTIVASTTTSPASPMPAYL